MSSEDIATDVSQHQAEAQPVIQEKMVPQSEVDRIVHARLMRERENAQMGMGGMQQAPAAFDKEALLKEAVQRMQEQQQEQQQAYVREQERIQAEQIAKDYLDKMEQGKHRYDDFEEVTRGFNPGNYSRVTVLASQHDNLADIIYDLKKNPQKLATMQVLALTDPQAAQEEMIKLSESIKKNEQALANNVKSPSPLSRLKSSAQAGQDTGKRTIRDMRQDPRYRG